MSSEPDDYDVAKASSLAKLKLVSYRTGLITLLIFLAAWWVACNFYKSILLTRERELISELAVPLQKSISIAVNSRISLIDSMHAFVLAHDEENLERDFGIFVEGLWLGVPGIRNFLVAPDGVIKYVVPLEGNEEAIGHDLLKDHRPEIQTEVAKALREPGTVVSGPQELLQGGKGIILRRAVYKSGEFWGFVSLVIEPDSIYKDAGLAAEINKLDTAVQNHEGETIFGKSAIFGQNSIISDVKFGDKIWKFAVAPKDKWGSLSQYDLRSFALITLFLALALSWITYSLLAGHIGLRYAVELKTRELSHANLALQREIGERIDAEKSTKASFERVKNVLDSMPLGCAIADANHRISYWNKAAEKILEFSREEILGKDFVGLIVPEAAKEHVEKVVENIISGVPINTSQNKNLTKSGRTIVCDWTNAPLKDDEGMPQEVLSMFRDVTDELKAKEIIAESQRKLVESEELFRLLAENVGDIIFKYRLKPDLGFEYVSPSCYQITGFTQAEHYADPFIEQKLAHPDDLQFVLDLYKQPSRFIGTYEVRWIRKDGENIWIEQHVSPIFDEKGDLIALTGVVRDISARKEKEAEISLANEFLEKVLSNLDESVFVIELDKRTIVDANKIAEKMFGFTRDEMLGSNSKMLHVDSHAFELFEILFTPQLESNGRFACEFSMKRKDGTIFPTEHFVTVLKDESTRPRRVISFVRDISYRKRAETERDLLEKQLKQSQKLEAIGLLAGGVAHDFNNLITGIFGYCDIADESLESGSEAKSVVGAIREAAQRAAVLTSRLLIFSRQQPVQSVVIDFNKLINGIIAFLKRVIREDIEFQFMPSPDAGSINCDKALIEQALMNLTINARDAMPKGGRLTMKTSKFVVTDEMFASGAWHSKGDFAQITIEDTGHGMSPEVLEHIYDPFFTTKEVGQGTGLGLAMVYGIVKQHNGTIKVESEPGKGTVFNLYFPASYGHEHEKHEAIKDEEKGGTETVLLVEDEEGLRKLARRALEKAGYSVLSASNGAEAIALFEVWHEEIAIVAMDVVMPKMGGVDAYSNMKKISEDVKVLFISGYTADSVPVSVEGEAKIMFIPKPYSVSILLNAVRALLDGGLQG